MYDKLKESLENSPIVDRNGYPYFVHPLTDGVPKMEPEVLEEVINWMLEVGDFSCDVILAPEAMGIPLAIPLSLKLRIPYTVARKRSYGLDGELTLDQETGYSKSLMTVNGITKGMRVTVVDDVVSTGGTLDALIHTLQKAGAVIVDVLVPVNKSSGTDIVLRSTGVKVKTMVSVRVEDGKVVVN
ncbi:MAG: adenine phosphoribosyltransferase [Candidatus Methanomethylophilus sp.]|nr:adenine phosphoribosyltransferase [Methanomethylophilus sp.]